MPTPLGDAEAARTDSFPGLHAYNQYLVEFHSPHPANSRENARIKNWIVSLVEDFQTKAQQNGIVMEIISKDDTKLGIFEDIMGKGEYWVPDSRNVLARIHGTDPELKHQSILVNAHFDSVPTSNGVTDNGMGTCVTLELLRYYVDHPPKHTLIFLLNNFEEGGLFGAHLFANHPWFESVKTFINLEGAGAGGKSILVRSSTLFGVKQLASSGAHYMQASPLGNDLMKSSIMKSDTDYTVFDKHGLSGMDLAFYGPRSHYHTQRDTLAYTSPNSLQYMGAIALGTLRNLDNSGLLKEDMMEPVVYYDILGRWIIAMSFSTFQFFNILALILVPLVPILWTLKKAHHQADYVSALKPFFFDSAQGILLSLTAFVTALISIALATFALYIVNPMATYGGLGYIIIYLVVAVFSGITGALILCGKCHWYKRNLEKKPEILLHGLNGVWWLLVLGATYLGSKEVSALYFAIYFLVSGALASLVFVTLPQENKYRLPLVFILQWTMPFLLLLQLILLSMTSLRHITVDGTPELAVYILTDLTLVLIILPMLFWIQLAGNQKSVLKISSSLLGILFIFCFFISPFNSDLSPNKLLYREEYNATASTTHVTVRSKQLEETVRSVLTKDELQTFECHTYADLPALRECSYDTTLVPVYGQLGLDKEAQFSMDKECVDGICTAKGTYSTKNSLLCRITFDENAASVAKAWIYGGPVVYAKNQPITGLVAYTDDYNTVVPFGFSWSEASPTPRARFNCIYNEWTKGELPAYVSLRDRLPADYLILVRGQGMTFVTFKELDL
ncbi:uncharacterized protein BX664DRAFT_257923 [Halteromyces radiatus]|uniref:uncharacterized protein n=1 Tax=Halteromyces radiatus TaxID=101107 RepID=UPI002220421B|nr:uncharacterized protein BX664DRAFT_257923 [Halteromyces radiatus]KAI8096685.1 hypothetical protein BX664DRAFT_257923 [Halteromyces radiatus]